MLNTSHSTKEILRIGICDDEPLSIDYISHYIEKWAEKHNYILHTHTFSNAEQFLFDYESDQNFDILFLDIQMGNMNGMDLARKIRETDSSVQIIFITALIDYISDGYEVSALHYLLKPVNEEKLYSVMDRASQNVYKLENYVLLTIDQVTQRIPINSIIYVEAFAHYIRITTAESSFEVRENLTSLAEKLGNHFVRPHRSYLINLKYIHRISKTEVFLDNGTSIPLSRYNYQNVNQAFIDYYKNQLNS